MPTFSHSKPRPVPVYPHPEAEDGPLSTNKPFFVPIPLQSYKSAHERLAEHAREWNYVREVEYKPYAKVAARSGKMFPLSTKRDLPDGSFWLNDGGYPANRRSALFVPVLAPRSWKSSKWSGKGQADSEHAMTLLQEGRFDELSMWAKVPAYEVIVYRYQSDQQVDKLLLYGLEDFNYPPRAIVTPMPPFVGPGAAYETDEMVNAHTHYIKASDPMRAPDMPDYPGWGRCIAINCK